MARSAKNRDPITKAQVQLVKTAQKVLGIDDDDYRSLLLARFRVSSCTQLTADQASQLIDHFVTLGFPAKSCKQFTYCTRGDATPRSHARSKRAPLSYKNVIRLASREEQAKISALASLIAWEFEDGLNRWLQKRFGIKKVRTAREAWLAIEGLKGMFANKMAKEHGKDWWTKDFSNAGIARFIREHCPEEYK
ncbi:MAG: regulatory protein GemA [Syntrophobacteraceae bacterium]